LTTRDRQLVLLSPSAAMEQSACGHVIDRGRIYCMTATATGCKVMWMRKFFDKIGYDTSKPSTLLLDNASAIQVAKNPKHQSTMKHVHRSYHWLCEHVEEGDIKVQHIPGAENVADIFT
jgi:hypothetical protein